ncbi:MAG: CYTH domain-containing protein [Pseudohongiella sp.]|nr:CYTH domain-containing protein [Pseudohongiella sp.]MDO9522040.1 CYTH domain-containing protein [Pseudohongiella sp.]MDP2128675.1 CYTH domain-containing protein [Pseudohongiella sp.]
MAIEIERKFLVNVGLLKQSGALVGAKSVLIRQAWLSRGDEMAGDKSATVRVRVAGDNAFLTIKGKTTGISRHEFEYPIPMTDALQLLQMCSGHTISKTRHLIPVDRHLWEVDEFHGLHQGLWLAEIELSDEQESFAMPEWLGEEVSHDARYRNSVLAHSANPVPD